MTTVLRLCRYLAPLNVRNAAVSTAVSRILFSRIYGRLFPLFQKHVWALSIVALLYIDLPVFTVSSQRYNVMGNHGEVCQHKSSRASHSKKFCLEEVPLFIYGLYPIQCSCTQESHPYDSAKQLLCRILQYKNPSTKVSGGTFPLHEARTLPASVGCTAVVTFVALHLQWFCQCCVLASMLLLLYSTTYSLCFGTWCYPFLILSIFLANVWPGFWIDCS